MCGSLGTTPAPWKQPLSKDLQWKSTRKTQNSSGPGICSLVLSSLLLAPGVDHVLVEFINSADQRNKPREHSASSGPISGSYEMPGGKES